MTHAYDEQYLSDAMNNLGEMMDYAVNTCHFEINEFFDMFLVSDLAGQFSEGRTELSPACPVELAMEVVRKSGADMELPDAEAEYDLLRNTGADGSWHSISGIQGFRSERCPRLYR